MELFFFASQYQKNSEAKMYPGTKYLHFLKPCVFFFLSFFFGWKGNKGFVLLDNIQTFLKLKAKERQDILLFYFPP